MANRVHLDAMIPREDFALEGEEFVLDLFPGFPIQNLNATNPILKLLRKPDFQRETNQWTPDQVATFIASFLDNEVIPSLILWKSSSYIFVIDGGHRLSALRAWMEDDYGDRAISAGFYQGEISQEQKKIANRTRNIIENRVGRFTTLQKMVESKGSSALDRRAKLLFTRAITVQWVQGTASVAESSFYKINSQGTPLDETEESLIRNRRKPIAIGARAVLRSGTGHKYWSAFPEENQTTIEKLAREHYDLLFEPEANTPIKTLDLPVGGAVSPLDALSELVEFLTIANGKQQTVTKPKKKADDSEPPKTRLMTISEYYDDTDGSTTIEALQAGLRVLNRITASG